MLRAIRLIYSVCDLPAEHAFLFKAYWRSDAC